MSGQPVALPVQASTAAGVLPAAGLVLRVADTWADLVADVVEAVRRHVPSDPFLGLPVLVRGPAARRALSQAIGLRTGRNGDHGVCAGVEFTSVRALRRDVDEALLGRPASADPWRRRALALTVLQVLQTSGDASWFEALQHHLSPTPAPGAALERPGRPLATAERVAALLHRYCREAPAMVRAWTLGDDVDPDGKPLTTHAAWQPQVWRRCREVLADVPDPVERHDLLLTAISASDARSAALASALPAHVLIADPGPLAAADHDFLAAIARVRPVTLFVVRPASDDTPWGRRLGRSGRAAIETMTAGGAVVEPVPTRRRRPASVLARLQATLDGTTVPAGARQPDGSVQVHASHGPDRQVEVLREVLCGLFVDDPTLEPRDVVVVCPDLDRFAPLVRAAFGSGGRGGETELATVARHPATQLRVQVAGSSLGEPNAALVLLQQLLALPSSRATGQHFLDLCANPIVARRFGLEAADIDLLARLLEAAQVRWGVDSTHRAGFGVGDVRQSTWLAAIDRLLVGVAMGEQPPGWLDMVAPVGMIGSNHLAVIGAASEIVSRVRQVLHLWQSEATMGEWMARLRDALDSLAVRSGSDAVVVAHARVQLAQLGDLTSEASALVSRGDIRGQFEMLLRTATGRANHGNGSLLVARMSDLDDVAHRVVVVLGLDDGVLPRPVRGDGDDLLPDSATPETGHRQVALRQFHEAIAAAGDRLVVIHQGKDARTNEPIPQAPILGDLVEVCEPLGGVTSVQHTLLPESINNFMSNDLDPPFSFDPVAVRGAQALDRRVSTRLDDAEPEHWGEPTASTDSLTPTGPQPREAVDISDLVTFLHNPAAALIRARLGLSLTSYETELTPELPIEADGLSRWRLGTAFLDAELAGVPLDDAERFARLSGDLPPHGLADQMIDQVRGQAVQVAEAVQARITRPGSLERIEPTKHRLHLDLTSFDAGELVAHITTRNSAVVAWRFGKVRLRDLIDAWIPLLALRASASASDWRAICIGTDGVTRLRAPSADDARALLADLVRLRARGLQQVVPMPLEVITALTPLATPGPWSPDPEKQARRAWDNLSERPEWRMTLPISWSKLATLLPQAGDPGGPAPSRLDRLRHWLVDPMLDHLDKESLP